jgi:hypothetical protein
MPTIPETLDLERFELESKVLAAALKQSVDLDDPDGAFHAHKQLFILLRANHHSPAGRLMASPVFNPISALGGNGGSHSHLLEDLSVAEEPHTAGHSSFIATDGPEEFIDLDEEFSGAKVLETPEPNLATLFAGEAEPAAEANAEEEAEEEVPNLAALFSDDFRGASTLSPTAQPATLIERGMRRTISDQTASTEAPKPAPADNVVPVPARPKRLHAIPERDASAETEKLFESIDNAKDVYAVLSVSQYASYELIHKSFLKLSRKLLLAGAKGQNRRDLERLRSLWIAHDILMDPKTRNDYDFRSIRSAKGEAKAQKEESGQLAPKSAMKIGELLQESGLLEPTELEIACDMHKAMPEMQFGRFLVKQGFIEDNQLEAVLLGQRLIVEGSIQIDQFKELMQLVNQGVGIRAALLQKGFLNKYEIEHLLGTEEPVVPKTDGFKPPPPPATRRHVAANSLSKVSFGHLDEDEENRNPGNGEPAAEEKKEEKAEAPKEKKPASTPASRVQKEIKITNARLLALLEEHGENFQSPELTRREGQIGGSTYGEIDLIAESEITPEPDSPEDPNAKKPRRQPKPKK